MSVLFSVFLNSITPHPNLKQHKRHVGDVVSQTFLDIHGFRPEDIGTNGLTHWPVSVFRHFLPFWIFFFSISKLHLVKRSYLANKTFLFHIIHGI